MEMNSGLTILADTQFLSTAFQFCSGPTLSALRACSRRLAEELPKESSLWSDLVAHSTAQLRTSDAMRQAIRLGRAIERCHTSSARHAESSDKALRHRLIVTGARRSGVSTLVQLLAQRDIEAQTKDMSVLSFAADLDGLKLAISAVDKRSTAIMTPLSAALYNGHTAALFVFDASCMEESVTKAAWCIEELQQTVGPRKFQQMPKLLVCHKADLLPPLLEDRVAALPPMCRGLLANFDMDLVFTSHSDPSSVQLAFALAAEGWPEADPDAVSRKFPTITRQQLRPTRTVVRRRADVRLGTVVTPGRRRTTVTSRPQSGNLFDELRARVPLAE
ncbi:unnamed protein product [Effrenium voratum]|uniref:Uncharacterized protein n=1 Tax=Effrenium voratum TaxID=2562239 RepID=A0AA36IVR4_9DINO|nr:unnamed protein product [Effrenium voratum]CAJ1434048.1 unnamed protein product [Effrenium voratum]